MLEESPSEPSLDVDSNRSPQTLIPTGETPAQVTLNILQTMPDILWTIHGANQSSSGPPSDPPNIQQTRCLRSHRPNSAQTSTPTGEKPFPVTPNLSQTTPTILRTTHGANQSRSGPPGISPIRKSFTISPQPSKTYP
jgi:hypothetical protein